MTRRTLLLRCAAVLLLPEAEARPRLTKAQERALRAAVRGRVFVPGSNGYDAARVVFNRRWDGVKPPAVVRVRDAADVRAVVRWADRYDIPLVSRSGGHGYNGNSTSGDAVVVDRRSARLRSGSPMGSRRSGRAPGSGASTKRWRGAA